MLRKKDSDSALLWLVLRFKLDDLREEGVHLGSVREKDRELYGFWVNLYDELDKELFGEMRKEA